MGMRDPTFIVAFWPSVDRMRGFCRVLVLESVSNALAVAVPIVTAKSFEFKCARLKSVGLVLLPVLGVQVVLPVGQVVLVALGDCSATLALCGQAMPNVRSQFLFTSSTAMSTTTSGRA